LFCCASCIKLARDRPLGIRAVVQVELADAAERTGLRAGRELLLHHRVDRRVAEPAGVVGAVAVQPNERHDGDAGRDRLRRCREGDRAVVRPAVRDDRAHAAALHARQHVGDRERRGRFLVVVQVGVEQRAGVGLGACAERRGQQRGAGEPAAAHQPRASRRSR
jgi:hypothetical protein